MSALWGTVFTLVLLPRVAPLADGHYRQGGHTVPYYTTGATTGRGEGGEGWQAKQGGSKDHPVRLSTHPSSMPHRTEMHSKALYLIWIGIRVPLLIAIQGMHKKCQRLTSLHTLVVYQMVLKVSITNALPYNFACAFLSHG